MKRKELTIYKAIHDDFKLKNKLSMAYSKIFSVVEINGDVN